MNQRLIVLVSVALALLVMCLQVFQAALKWISHDVIQRKRFVFELLRHVRLPLLSVCLLEKTITECTDTSLKVLTASSEERHYCLTATSIIATKSVSAVCDKSAAGSVLS